MISNVSSIPVSRSSAVVRTFKSSDDSDSYGSLEIDDRIRPAPNPTP